MNFSDTSTEKSGLIQECEMLVFNEYGKITGNSNLLAVFTNNLNRARDDARLLVAENDGDWPSDDISYSDTSTITADIVSGQGTYTLDDDTQRILQVRVKDEAGNWSYPTSVGIFDPLYKSYKVGDTSNRVGIPTLYSLFGDQLELLPEPNYSSNEGIELRTQRVSNYYLTTDTVKATGLPSILDRTISLNASLFYTVPNQISTKSDLFSLLERQEEKVEKHFSQRQRGRQKFIRPIIRSSR